MCGRVPIAREPTGKAERFIQTCLREWAYQRPYRTSAVRAAALPNFTRRYNIERPHCALQQRPPWLGYSNSVNNVLSNDT